MGFETQLKIMLHWFWGWVNDGDGGHIPKTARAHPQNFQCMMD